MSTIHSKVVIQTRKRKLIVESRAGCKQLYKTRAIIMQLEENNFQCKILWSLFAAAVLENNAKGNFEAYTKILQHTLRKNSHQLRTLISNMPNLDYIMNQLQYDENLAFDAEYKENIRLLYEILVNKTVAKFKQLRLHKMHMQAVGGENVDAHRCMHIDMLIGPTYAEFKRTAGRFRVREAYYFGDYSAIFPFLFHKIKSSDSTQLFCDLQHALQLYNHQQTEAVGILYLLYIENPDFVKPTKIYLDVVEDVAVLQITKGSLIYPLNLIIRNALPTKSELVMVPPVGNANAYQQEEEKPAKRTTLACYCKLMLCFICICIIAAVLIFKYMPELVSPKKPAPALPFLFYTLRYFR